MGSTSLCFSVLSSRGCSRFLRPKTVSEMHQSDLRRCADLGLTADFYRPAKRIRGRPDINDQCFESEHTDTTVQHYCNPSSLHL